MRTLIGMVLFASGISVFAFWLEIGLMSRFAPAPVVRAEATQQTGTDLQRAALVEACAGNTDQRICANQLTRVVATRQTAASTGIAWLAGDCSHVAPFFAGYDPT